MLSGHRGPLGVLEAKKEDVDPYDAKEQARGYAENVKAPFVILSNGRIHYFWNLQHPEGRDAYRIEKVIFEKNAGPKGHAVVHKKFVGHDASLILQELGIPAGPEVRCILVEVPTLAGTKKIAPRDAGVN